MVHRVPQKEWLLIIRNISYLINPSHVTGYAFTKGVIGARRAFIASMSLICVLDLMVAKASMPQGATTAMGGGYHG